MGYSHCRKSLFDELMIFPVQTAPESGMGLTPQAYQFIYGQSAGLCFIGQYDADLARFVGGRVDLSVRS